MDVGLDSLEGGMKHTEYCPWCSSYIEVDMGVQPCPKCHRPIRVTSDMPVIDSKLISLALRLLGVRL